jgi:tripartite-type tricarboxylate transporter receptor subunit TctC
VALAVTSLKRVDLLPGVPTVAESGAPGFEARGWYGLLAPAGIPVDVTERLTMETLKIARSTNLQKLIATFGSDNVAQGPSAFSSSLRPIPRSGAALSWREHQARYVIADGCGGQVCLAAET